MKKPVEQLSLKSDLPPLKEVFMKLDFLLKRYKEEAVKGKELWGAYASISQNHTEKSHEELRDMTAQEDKDTEVALKTAREQEINKYSALASLLIHFSLLPCYQGLKSKSFNRKDPVTFYTKENRTSGPKETTTKDWLKILIALRDGLVHLENDGFRMADPRLVNKLDPQEVSKEIMSKWKEQYMNIKNLYFDDELIRCGGIELKVSELEAVIEHFRKISGLSSK